MLVVNARVAQLDRAFGYEPKGREFESCHARFFYEVPKKCHFYFMLDN